MIGLICLALAAQAPAIPKTIVSVAGPETVVVEAGGRAQARLTFTIEDGFRIQANPAAERFLIPATLELEGDERVSVGPVGYPPGKPYRLRGADNDLSIYEGTVVIDVSLKASHSAATDTERVEVVLEGELRYQACNEIVCLRPSSLPVRLPVEVRGASESPPP